jgi:hypothetical protein
MARESNDSISRSDKRDAEPDNTAAAIVQAGTLTKEGQEIPEPWLSATNALMSTANRYMNAVSVTFQSWNVPSGVDSVA